jgi:transcriptional regulator with XRE-family HTH domain
MLPSLIFQALRPKSPNYPKELVTLGDHIRSRRLDLGLEQGAVASQIGVSTATLLNWELNKREPEIRSYPRIMEFLGYCPVRYPRTFGERLWLLRTHRGLSLSELANILRVDPGTLGSWERDRMSPQRQPSDYLDRVAQLPFTAEERAALS